MNRAQSYFSDSAAVILFILAALNILGAVNSSPTLNWPDALLPLSNRLTLVLVGVAEFTVSAVVLAWKSKWVKLGWLAWLMTNLLVYRIGLWSDGACNFGDCLGNYVEWFSISPKTTSLVIEVLLGIMLAGSYFFLVVNWARGEEGKSAKANKPATGAQPAS